MFSGLLPIGTVVKLTGNEKRVMIIGILQTQKEDDKEILWDYSACLYPEGYLSQDKIILFNDGDIEKIYNLGYQDTEQFVFKEKADEIREQLYSAINAAEESV